MCTFKAGGLQFKSSLASKFMWLSSRGTCTVCHPKISFKPMIYGQRFSFFSFSSSFSLSPSPSPSSPSFLSFICHHYYVASNKTVSRGHNWSPELLVNSNKHTKKPKATYAHRFSFCFANTHVGYASIHNCTTQSRTYNFIHTGIYSASFDTLYTTPKPGFPRHIVLRCCSFQFRLCFDLQRSFGARELPRQCRLPAHERSRDGHPGRTEQGRLQVVRILIWI